MTDMISDIAGAAARVATAAVAATSAATAPTAVAVAVPAVAAAPVAEVAAAASSVASKAESVIKDIEAVPGWAYAEIKTLSASDVWAKVFTWGPIVAGDILTIALSWKFGGGFVETFGFVASFTSGALFLKALDYLATSWAALKKQSA